MTTIIIDNKDKKVYTDKRCTRSWDDNPVTTHFAEDQIKVMAYMDKLVVLTGDVSEGNKIYKYITDPVPKLKYPSSSAIIFVVSLEGQTLQLMKYETKETPLWKRIFLGRYFYWDLEITKEFEGYRVAGSGSVYAAGALAAGVTPKEAIVAASICDIHTNSNIDIFDLNDLDKESNYE